MNHKNYFRHECKCGSVLEIFTDDEVTAQKDMNNWIRKHKCPNAHSAGKNPSKGIKKNAVV